MIPTETVKLTVALFVAAVLTLFAYKCYSYTKSLKDELASNAIEAKQLADIINKTQKDLLVEKLESERYKAALEQQSQAVHEQRYKLEKSKQELLKWKADSKKYESIEKHLPPQTIIYRSNCEDIKNYFDGLDGFSLDSLQ